MKEDLYDDDDGELVGEFMEDCPIEEHGAWYAMRADRTDDDSVAEVLEAYLDSCRNFDVEVDTGDALDLVVGGAWLVRSNWPDMLASFGTVQVLDDVEGELRRQAGEVWADVEKLEIGDLPELPDGTPAPAP